MLLEALLLLCSIGSYAKAEANPQNEVEYRMAYQVEKKDSKQIIGIQINTDNNTCLTDMPKLWGKFMQEQILDKIPHKTGSAVYAVYSDYEGDETKPYTYLIGCEVSSLDQIPEGMVGKRIHPCSYAVFKTEGPFPQSLSTVWQTIWKTPLKRAFTADFEVYEAGFNPQTNPEVKVYIAL